MPASCARRRIAGEVDHAPPIARRRPAPASRCSTPRGRRRAAACRRARPGALSPRRCGCDAAARVRLALAVACRPQLVAADARPGRCLEHDQLRAHRHHVPRLPRRRDDLAAHRRRHLHRRLLRHHLDDHVVLGDLVARLHAPADDLRLDRALAQVRQLEDVPAHPASITLLQRRGDARRPREILPLERMRIRRIPAGDALDRRLQMPEALLLHGRRRAPRRSR